MQPQGPPGATVARAVSVRGRTFAVVLALLALGSLPVAPVGADQNTETTTRVRDEGIAVRALSRKLNDMVVTQQHVTSAQMIQRDEVAQLQFALQARQAPYLRSRARRQAQLASLRSRRNSLEKR